jgi:diphthamide synthase (EF-2-diphthine--ammonia ligase)
MADAGMDCHFPLWGRDTVRLAREMVDAGVQATVTSIDPRLMPREFAGAAFDHELLDALPSDVDPCGERGEFHTFVSDGPGFSRPVTVAVGDVVERDGFVFCDVVPVGT